MTAEAGGVVATGVPPAIGTPRMSGRQSELAALTAAVARPPALVLVEGEAGVGKTRLVQEYLASPAGRDARSLVVSMPPFREPFTLGPVIDALRGTVGGVAGLGLSGLAGALRPLLPEWGKDLPPAPEPLADARAERHRVFRALAELLDRLGVGVVVVEDVHWADDASLEFLLFLSVHRTVPSLVVTCRTEDLPEDSLLPRLSAHPPADVTYLRLLLEPLDAAGTAEMVSSMLGDAPVAAGFAQFLHEHTGGLPLVVEEAVRLMGERADLAHRGGRWVRRKLVGIDVPPTVRDAVLERARRLTGDALAVLRAAAVLGEPCDEVVLASVSALAPDRCATALGEALAGGLLRAGARGYALRHALAADAVRDATPAPLRRLLHLRAGRALEGVSPRPVARLAHHFRAAGQVAEWCRYAERAAEQARNSFDDAAAGRLLHEVVTTAGVGAGTAARLTGRIPFQAYPEPWLDELARTLRSLADDEDEPVEDRGRARFQLGRVLHMMGRLGAARVALERSVEQLPAGSLEAARAMLLLAWPRAADVPAAEHLRWLRRAKTVTAPVSPVDRLRLTVERIIILLSLGQEDGWAEAARFPRDAATAEERRHIVRGLVQISDMAIFWGRYAEAREYMDLALAVADRHQITLVRRYGPTTELQLDWLLGAWAGLAERVEEIAAAEGAPPTMRREAWRTIGLLHLAAGAYDLAAEHLRSVAAEARGHGALDAFVEASAGLSRALLWAGRREEACDATEAPAGVVAAKSTWLWASDLVPVRTEALLAAGRDAEAADLVARFGQGLRGLAAPAPRAALALCRALLAAHRGAHLRGAAVFARAATLWRDLPRPYDALLAEERQAACLLAAGRLDAGLDLLTAVHAGLSTLGASGCAARVARRLREHGVGVHAGPDPLAVGRQRARGGRRGYGDELSPRELEVIGLVATGLTNRQIGQALAVSPRTVGRHLDRAMRKLGVSSRTALAVKAVQAGVAERPPGG